MPPIPDLVYLSQLDAQYFSDTQEVSQVTLRATGQGQRKIREQQSWRREKELGKGGFGVVYLERCVQGNHVHDLRAVKELRKLASDNYNRELEAAALFSHSRYEESFVKSYGWYETTESIYLTMEYLPHGDLQQHLGQAMAEAGGRTILSQVLEGLSHMHDRGFTHRDLKPALAWRHADGIQNILVSCLGPQWWVKLADFGISKRAEGADALRTQIFTPAFAAPEVVFVDMDAESDAYTSAVDLWSAGVIALTLLTGDGIFNDRRALRNYCKGDATQVSNTLRRASEGAAGLVRNLLTPDPAARPTSREALKHRWLSAVHDPTVQPGASIHGDAHGTMPSETIGPVDAPSTSPLLPSAKWSFMEETSLASPRANPQDDDASAEDATMGAYDRKIASHDRHFDIRADAAREAYLQPSPGPSLRANEQEGVDEPPYEQVRDPSADQLRDPAARIKMPSTDPDGSIGIISTGQLPVRQQSVHRVPVDEKHLLQVQEGGGGVVSSESSSSKRSSPDVHVLSGPRTIAEDLTDVTEQRGLDPLAKETLPGRDWEGTLHGHRSAVREVAISPDGRLLTSAADDGMFHLRDLADGEIRQTYQLQLGLEQIECIAIAPDSQSIVTRAMNGPITWWSMDNLDGLRSLARLASASDPGSPSVQYSPDRLLIAWHADGQVVICQRGTLEECFIGHHSEGLLTKRKLAIGTFAFSASSKWIICGSRDSTSRPVIVTRLSFDGGQKRPTHLWTSESKVAVKQISCSSDGKIAAALNDGHRIAVLNAQCGLLHIIDNQHTQTRIGRLLFSPDGKAVASAFVNGQVRLWDVDDGSLITTFSRPDQDYPRGADTRDTVFSPDGKAIASIGFQTVAVWSTQSLKMLFADRQPPQGILRCLAFSPNSRIVAYSAGNDVRVVGLVPKLKARKRDIIKTIN
ncbi:hypothetical protein LTR53_011433 [Teratosphaeriaceae sp. CCFEE 6253]|nr:hypothetical protein LTR53_011433 [Teratosphaeriaceae sp. CCFEE 6253]